MLKRLFLQTALVLLLSIVVLTACAAPAPAPTPTPTPAPAPKPAPKEIILSSQATGSTCYIFYYALSEFTNKYSTWLRATPIESAGTAANVKLLNEYPKGYIAFTSNITCWMANAGRPPPPIPIKVIGTWGQNITAPVTLDPKIKTVADLKGHSMTLLYKGAHYEEMWDGFLSTYGMSLNDLKITYALFDKASDFLKSGTVDVADVGGLIGPGWSTAPAYSELLATKNPYHIAFTPKEFEAARAKTGLPLVSGTLPKKIIPSLPQDMLGVAYYSYVNCHADMDDAVVTEILDAIAKNVENVGSYHASLKGFNLEWFADIGLPEKYFHPAALKWYKQHNIPIKKYD